ncbi:hypothetical protein OESDEN_08525 [Oesophagostomum dentatum]|uniref:Nucleotide-diphospho-sugar transferase domain-containing protein n=1 Tax=Oesophagostomum dentatum TaxID=61180 RepID=A0A0B1T253_OESDE|nr:hypothetical protein OESDEN_08525 [Oesophagostomum dentatum]
MEEPKPSLQHMNYSDVRMIYGNLVREKFGPKIAILEVIEAGTPPGIYETAMGFYVHLLYSMKLAYGFFCVTERHWWVVFQKFFRRHCVVAHSLKDYDYVLFMDADIGVVNPQRLIEEFLDLQADIVFYDRFYNWEVTAGTYIAKNSHWSRAFLHGRFFAAYLVELLVPKSVDLPECMLIYNNSKSYASLFLFEACIRKILGYGTHFGNVRIMRKGTGWARDHRMTNSKWSKETDFMIHNWKMKYQRIYNSTPIP